MKLSTAFVLTACGIIASSAVALAVPVAPVEAPVADVSPEPAPGGARASDAARAVAGETLMMDARLGHPTLTRGDDGETYLFAQVAGGDGAARGATVAPPTSLAVVIDKSGSMKGERIGNALSAAVMALERLREGDAFTVVAFDTQADVVVPATRITAESRPRIEAAIRGIRLGGDTCISCGLEAAMTELDRVPAGRERVQRMVLLSDGATNAGIRDVPGLRAMAGRMRSRGVTISTIGVDVDFDEKVMAAIANEANGHHYFVAHASGLERVFADEFDAVLASVARDAELTVDLAPGVDAVEVFDRPFRREGSRVVIPFGTFSAKEEKTVLVRLRVPTRREGDLPVANVALRYRDLMNERDASFSGALAAHVREGGERPELDPFVAARLERSRTARTLSEASRLFEQGRADDARQRLRSQAQNLEAASSKALALAQATPSAAPRRSAKSLDRDFRDQLGVVAEAERGFAAAAPAAAVPGKGAAVSAAAGPEKGDAFGGFAPPPPSAEGRAQVRRNQEESHRLGF